MSTPKPKPKRTVYRKILNFFIGVFGVLIFLILAFTGYSQTKSFRDYVKKEIISSYSESFNGELSINKLNGSLFSTLSANGIKIEFDNQPILSIDKLALRINLLSIFRKTIGVSELILDKPILNLLEIQPGNWNIDMLVKNSTDSLQIDNPANLETAQTSFPFLINVKKFVISDLSLNLQDFNHLNSDTVYSSMNYGDVRIKNLNLSTRILADINRGEFAIDILKLNAQPNLQEFLLKDFGASIYIRNKSAELNNVIIITENSDINFNAKINDFNLLNMPEYSSFKSLPINFELNASPFNFNDLSSFIKATEFLNGSPKLKLKAKGLYGKLEIEDCNINYKSTNLKLSGKLNNLHDPANLFIDVAANNSNVSYDDALQLLDGLNLPELKEIDLSNAKLKFKGRPTKFYSEVNGKVNGNGTIDVAGNLDFSAAKINYDLAYATTELNLKNIIGIKSNISAKGNLKGIGVDPSKLEAQFEISADNSHIGDYYLDSLNVNASSKANMIKMNLAGNINNAKSNIRGTLDFTQGDIPFYNLQGFIDSLNLYNFFGDSLYDSNLNFQFSAAGRDLSIENIIGNFVVKLKNSEFKNQKISDSNLDLSLAKDSIYRRINLNSDFLDMSVEGNFSIAEATALLIHQSKSISKIISDKIAKMNPTSILDRDNFITISDTDTTLSDYDVKFDFSFKVKNFELLALLLNAKDFDISGNGAGSVSNNSEKFSIESEVNLEYLMNADSSSLIYFSKLNSDINFVRNNHSNEFKDLFGSISFDGNKLFVGSDFENISADLVFNDENLFVTSSFTMDKNLSSFIDASVEMSPNSQIFNFSELSIDYKNTNWENLAPFQLTIAGDSLSLNDFTLANNSALLNIDGSISSNRIQNIDFELKNFPGKYLTKYLTDNTDERFSSELNLEGNITGTTANPIINIQMNAENISYDNINFGKLNSVSSYENENIVTNLKFIGRENNKTLFSVDGNIPFNLSLGANNGSEPLGDSKLEIKADGFNIRPLSNLIPQVSDLTGLFSADVEITGDLNNINYKGFTEIKNGFVRLNANNLGYGFSAKTKLNGNKMLIDKFEIKNVDNTKLMGRINLDGEVTIDQFELSKYNLIANGDLAILSDGSKMVSPTIYGDLFFNTNGDLILSNYGGRTKFIGDLLLKNTNLTFTPENINNTVSDDKIYYKFKTDSSNINIEERKFREYLLSRNRLKNEIVPTDMSFDYNIKIGIDEEAKIDLYLSRIWNQKLSVIANGSLEYSNIEGRDLAQGALELQSGSKLEFVKTFDATGKIKFETDLANPFVDVVAAYTGTYNQGTDELPDIIDVEVELKLSGTLDNLGSSLTNNPDNISIYKGARNINERVRDNQYDISDAILFIYVGRFKDDLTANDKSQLAGFSNTATSFLGSALAAFVSSAVGDVVSDISVDQSEAETKIMISGKYEKIRYSVGGTTRIQNINEANVKIEYMLLPNLLFRLERKDPIVRSFGIDEKISELGLKYRVEF